MRQGFQLDLARQIERPELAIAGVERLLRQGYSLCMAYWEDALAFASHPELGREHAWTMDDAKRLHAVCAAAGAELVPVFPFLGHANWITGKPGHERLDEGHGEGKLLGSLTAGMPEVYALADDLIKEWCAQIPGAYVHVGLDESAASGRGFIRAHGLDAFDATKTFADHANALGCLVKAQGRRMVMWGDMFYHFPKAIALLDKDIVVVDWYYYGFDTTPKVESYNFAPVDLSGELRAAGITVWGAPSVWPNYPFPQLEGRMDNLNSWRRYGEERGVERLVNTEWENSYGFFAITELALSALARHPKDKKELTAALKDVIAQCCGAPVTDRFAADLLTLGDAHLTGRNNRNTLARPLLAKISTSTERVAEFKRQTEALADCFTELPELRRQCRTPEGLRLLDAIDLSRQIVSLFWRSGALMSEAYDALLQRGMLGRGKAIDNLDALGHQASTLLRRYLELWEQTRYPDDAIALRPWLQDTLDQTYALRTEVARYPDPNKTRLFSTPRLELEIECQRPAIPVLTMRLEWDDGRTIDLSETMIQFENRFATSRTTWRQYPVFPLDATAPPARITFATTHYGQVGIKAVKVVQLGKERRYRPERWEGPHVVQDADALWLGPTGATPADPTMRTTWEKAVYAPEG